MPHVLHVCAPLVGRTLLNRTTKIAAHLIPAFFSVRGRLHLRSNSPVLASLDENSYTPDSPLRMGDRPAVLHQRACRGQKRGTSSWGMAPSSFKAKLSRHFFAIPSSARLINETPDHPSSARLINETPYQRKAQQRALADSRSLRSCSWPYRSPVPCD